MPIVDSPALVAPIVFPVDLSGDVPEVAFSEGYRARWLAPTATDRGVLEIVTTRAGALDVVTQYDAATAAEASEAVWFDVDWDAVMGRDDLRDREEWEVEGAI